MVGYRANHEHLLYREDRKPKPLDPGLRRDDERVVRRITPQSRSGAPSEINGDLGTSYQIALSIALRQLREDGVALNA